MINLKENMSDILHQQLLIHRNSYPNVPKVFYITRIEHDTLMLEYGLKHGSLGSFMGCKVEILEKK